MDSIEESEHIKKLSEGDVAAFDSLFLHYYPKLVTFISHMIKDPDEARDRAQDIFFTLWINRSQLDTIRNFKSYLYQMARNSIVDYFRSKHITCQVETVGDFVVQETSLSEELEANDLSVLIDLAIQNMPAQRRQVFCLSRKEGLSNDEIAEQLSLSKRTVETHISNAIKEIRTLLKSILSILL